MTVHPVQGRRDLRAFIDLPYRLHAQDPVWVPPLRSDMRDRLARDKNPFFEHAQAEHFLAEREGKVVGRIAAIANKLHDEIHRDAVAFFGFFECVNDQGVADALFGAAATWARDRDYRVLRGPTSFSVNDECGLLVEGFETPPVLMMPHNPRYYVKLIEAAGFTKAKDLWAFQGGHPEHYAPVPGRAARAAEVMRRRLGITLRALDRKDFQTEVERIKRAYNAAWEHNWGFVPLTDREIEHMAKQFKPVLIPDLVPFAEKDGEIIGFGLALPDLNVVLRSNRRGRLFPALLKIFWALYRRRIRRTRVLLLGVRPEYRGKGVDAMLWHWIWTRAAEHGIYWGEASWILEDNPAMSNAAERMSFTRYKTYRLYDRGL